VPLIFAAVANHTGVVKLLLKRGADGTKMTTRATPGMDVGSTALDTMRVAACINPGYTDTLEVLNRRCCSTCGMTSPGLAVKTEGERKHFKRCGDCPAGGPRARYCSEACQGADWVPRHRGECAEARRVRQAATTPV
jgi:hypothetical protein